MFRANRIAYLVEKRKFSRGELDRELKKTYTFGVIRIILSAAALAAAQGPSTTTATAPAPEVSTASAPPVSFTTAAPVGKPPPLRLLSEAELPRFDDSFKSHAGLVKAAKKSLKYLEKQTGRFRIADRDYAPGILIDSIKELLALFEKNLGPDEFNAEIRKNFDVFQSVGLDGAGRVVFSSYYQPVLEASLKKSSKYPYPLYRRPPDMVNVDLSQFDKKYNGETLVGRVTKDKTLVPYYNRDQIDAHKALAGKSNEIAWLKDKFDVLDLHIQGSGILKLAGGKEVLAQFAATSAHPYNSAAQLLVKSGAIPKEEITHDKVRAYFRAHPESQDWIMGSNPRYTFFKLVPLPEDGEPFGTINESLSPARSIAIDPSVIPLGAVAFFSTTSPQADKEGRLLGMFPNSRFALCMDTGGAIKGPGRVDIYAGHGPQAATTARGQWNDGQLYILIKKVPPRER